MIWLPRDVLGSHCSRVLDICIDRGPGVLACQAWNRRGDARPADWGDSTVLPVLDAADCRRFPMRNKDAR